MDRNNYNVILKATDDDTFPAFIDIKYKFRDQGLDPMIQEYFEINGGTGQMILKQPLNGSDNVNKFNVCKNVLYIMAELIYNSASQLSSEISSKK